MLKSLNLYKLVSIIIQKHQQSHHLVFKKFMCKQTILLLINFEKESLIA